MTLLTSILEVYPFLILIRCTWPLTPVWTSDLNAKTNRDKRCTMTLQSPWLSSSADLLKMLKCAWIVKNIHHLCMYTNVQNVGSVRLFSMFLKEISFAHQGCIYMIRNTVKQSYCEILLQFKRTVFYFIYYFPVMAKVKCTVFNVTWSLRNHSNHSLLIWCSWIIS